MNHYPRYPAYKSSGINWLGKIPAHWDVMRLKFACQINPPKSEISSLPEKTPVSFLPMEKIGEDGSLDLSENRAIGEVKQGFTYFRDNDVIVAKITPCFENGKGALVRNLKNGLGFGTTELHVLRCYIGSYPGFIFYLARNHFFKVMGTSEMSGVAGQQRVPTSFVENFRAGFPPFEEQQAIVAFLDEQTAVLDNLISEKQAIIGLLQEKRAAVISRAVTQGLNSAVALKDSGVDWIDRIPAHWESTTFRRICHLQQGLQIAQSERFSEPGPHRLEYITVRSIHAGNSLETREYIENPPDRVICYPDDILMARTGATGEVITNQHGAFHNNFFKVNYDRAKINRDYLVYYLSKEQVKEYLLLMAGTTTIPDLNHGAFLDTPVVFPALEEQHQIVRYLDTETAKLNETIIETEASITTLQEYRTALIATAVTGQIDVRGYGEF